jgi:Ribonuclease G/E
MIAAAEIAQLRMGGIIVIDFIDLSMKIVKYCSTS